LHTAVASDRANQFGRPTQDHDLIAATIVTELSGQILEVGSRGVNTPLVGLFDK
jgi:hypothetical protein